MNDVIAIEHLTKRYRDTLAVDDASFSVPAGSVCGLLGPNGAGKTTTFKCLLGFVRPESGTATIDGAPVGPETFEHLAFVPEVNALYPWMTVGDHLAVQRSSFRAYDGERARELLALFKLDPKRRVGRLSKGQRTAVALVLAFAIRPRVLILDEPTSGLDPILQRAVLDLIIEAASAGATVLFSSHQIGQIERAADRVAIVVNGKVIVHDEIDALKGSQATVEAVFDGTIPTLDGLGDDPRVMRLEKIGTTLRATVASDAESVALRIRDLRPRDVRVLGVDLEEVFLRAVRGDVPPEQR